VCVFYNTLAHPPVAAFSVMHCSISFVVDVRGTTWWGILQYVPGPNSHKASTGGRGKCYPFFGDMVVEFMPCIMKCVYVAYLHTLRKSHPSSAVSNKSPRGERGEAISIQIQRKKKSAHHKTCALVFFFFFLSSCRPFSLPCPSFLCLSFLLL
jgi:hypothetical protein